MLPHDVNGLLLTLASREDFSFVYTFGMLYWNALTKLSARVTSRNSCIVSKPPLELSCKPTREGLPPVVGNCQANGFELAILAETGGLRRYSGDLHREMRQADGLSRRSRNFPLLVAYSTYTGANMPKNLKRRGSVWWFRKRIKGKDEEFSLQTSDLGRAKERRDRVLEEMKDRGLGPWCDNRKRTFNEAAQRFGKEHFRTLKRKSIARYQVSIAQLLDDLDRVPLVEIGTARLDNFVQRRREAGASNSTIRRDLACLSAIFSKVQVWEWVTNNPVGPFLRDRGKSGLKEGSPRKRYLLRDEEDEILPFAPPKAAKAMIFAIDTGLRKEEQFSLEWHNVNFNKREILVEAGTTKKNHGRCPSSAEPSCC